jgi:hypothetical protein
VTDAMQDEAAAAARRKRRSKRRSMARERRRGAHTIDRLAASVVSWCVVYECDDRPDGAGGAHVL